MTDHDKQRNAARADEDEAERLDRELLELLNELRVVMPGVQVLFGFLLTVPFQQRFGDVTDFQRNVYVVTLLLAAGAAAFLMAPTAFHRITFRDRQKPRLIRIGHLEVLAGLVLLALAMTGAVLLIADFLFHETTTVVITAAVGALFAVLWFVLPVVNRTRKDAW